MPVMSGRIQLLSFDVSRLLTSIRDLVVALTTFSTPTVENVCCPNCGHRIVLSSAFICNKENVSRILTVVCCGAYVWYSYAERQQLYDLAVSTARRLSQCGQQLMKSIVHSGKERSYTGCDQSTRNTSNHILVWNQYGRDDDHDLDDDDLADQSYNEPESISLSPLNSIGFSTVERFDRLLEQVEQIKQGMAGDEEFISDFRLPQSASSAVLDVDNYRQMSQSELTLPSLEWDLNDLNLEDGDDKPRKSSRHLFHPREHLLSNVKSAKLVDIELLAQMLFDNNFHMQEERKFISRKHYAQLKHQLRFMALNYAQQQQHNGRNDNLVFASKRDSAFFDDF